MLDQHTIVFSRLAPLHVVFSRNDNMGYSFVLLALGAGARSSLADAGVARLLTAVGPGTHHGSAVNFESALRNPQTSRGFPGWVPKENAKRVCRSLSESVAAQGQKSRSWGG